METTTTLISTYADLLRVSKVAALFVSKDKPNLMNASLAVVENNLTLSATDSYQAIIITTTIFADTSVAQRVTTDVNGYDSHLILSPKDMVLALAAHKGTAKGTNPEIRVTFDDSKIWIASEAATNSLDYSYRDQVPDYASLLPKNGSMSEDNVGLNPALLGIAATACEIWRGKSALPMILHHVEPGRPAHWSLTTDEGTLNGLLMPMRL